MKIPLTTKVWSYFKWESANFQPLTGTPITGSISSVFTKAFPPEFSQSSLHCFNMSIIMVNKNRILKQENKEF